MNDSLKMNVIQKMQDYWSKTGSFHWVFFRLKKMDRLFFQQNMDLFFVKNCSRKEAVCPSLKMATVLK